MTNDEARNEAINRWGKDAFAHFAFGAIPPRFEVGVCPATFPRVLGHGDSWEAAFSDADARLESVR